MTPMRFNLIAGTVAAALFLLTGSAFAAPPRPLPNPDRPASTPVLVPDAGTSASTVTLSSNSACASMRKTVQSGNSRAGLVVKNLGTGKVVCSFSPRGQYSLASNTKIFTTATALGRLGPSHRMLTRVFASGRIDRNGVLNGDLYLMGGGDPSLGTRSFLNAFSGGAGTDINRLALKVKRAGIKRVTGRVYGDASVFDRLRGVADSGYATSPWIGPLSGLSINAGYTNAGFSSFSSDPARLAAKMLALRLRGNGVKVRAEVALRRTPGVRARRLVAKMASPDMTWMSSVTNLNSNNFFAEMLLKHLGAEVRGSGTTRAGASVVRQYVASSFGARVSPVDGSGLTISNRSSALDVVKVLSQIRSRKISRAFYDSLPLAGKSGTLADRMRGSAAQGRCRAKTGTLTGVSALSGYCFSKAGRRYAFSILMNGVYNTDSARKAQDRIAALIARM
jgi:D-alanyl-D-alanine carboxypeptidase/D-alanyl-D-alanine-endopeptidase (penicillin-binding protein 4)